jgi:fluoroacetyl-CoA thioesterase
MSLKSRTGEATLRLYPAHVADGFPAVLARSRMIELMELAATRLMKPHLGESDSSVSIEMQVTHVAAVGAGSALRAVATYAGITGRLHRFTINVFDESGLIGSAEHTRAVVTERRLLDMAQARAARSGALLPA